MKFDIDLKKLNENYGKICPCVILKANSLNIEDFKCPCKNFREKGICICGVFKKTVDKSKDL